MTKARRFNLHDVLREKTYDHAFLLTYAFSPGFFENYCLENFRSLNENGNITVLLDGVIHDELINPTDEGGFDNFPAKANVRYLLHPIRIPGRFHPKMFLFAGEKRGLLVIGSANLTRDGICSNAEMVGCYEFLIGEKEGFRSLFRSAVQYLLELCERFPSDQLTANINAMLTDISWIEGDGDQPILRLPQFIHNLSQPLWDQIKSGIKSPVSCVHILSRYFDQSPHLLEQLVVDLNPTKIRIYTQNGITTLTEKWLNHVLVKQRTADVFACFYEDGSHPQPLHAKALAIETREGVTMAFGSANFTASAFSRTAKQGNAEVMLILREIPKSQFSPSEVFDPSRNATLIASASELRTAERRQVVPGKEKPPISISVAWVQDEELRIKADVPQAFANESCFIILRNPTGRPRKLPCSNSGSDVYKVIVPAEIEAQLSSGANIVQMVIGRDGAIMAESNYVLVTNVQDLQSGRGLREERHRREALENASKFIEILRELASKSDEAELLKFLQLDIPLITTLRSVQIRRAGIRILGNIDEMRHLGEHSLRQFFTVHEAVIAFVNRHLRRLSRHVKDGTASGIPNFMHILLAVSGLLEMQMEKACVAFENQVSPLSVDQWKNFRVQADAYLHLFVEIVSVFTSEYIPQMIGEYSKQDVLAGLGDDLREFRKIFAQMLGVRARIEQARLTKLTVQAGPYDLIKPDYFNSTLGDPKWAAYHVSLTSLASSLERQLTT